VDRGGDLNPRPPECKEKPTVSSLPFEKEAQFEAIDWEKFENWLKQTHTPRFSRDIVIYAKRYLSYLQRGDLSEIGLMSHGKRRMIMTAFSNLCKFLGKYEDWKRLVHAFQLKWSDRSKDEIIIERLTKVKDVDDVFNWIRQVKAVRPDFSDLLDLMALTGMRLLEAVNSYNLIIKLHREGRLNEYYNEETEALEHYKFIDLFLRKSKKAFVSFVPKSLVLKIAENGKPLNKHGVCTSIQRYGLPLRFGDIREVHNTIMSKHLSESEVNFLAGRIGSSVFMSNYFNIKWITDLKERMSKGIMEIQSKLS
jgi:intergrase/recombinase